MCVTKYTEMDHKTYIKNYKCGECTESQVMPDSWYTADNIHTNKKLSCIISNLQFLFYVLPL